MKDLILKSDCLTVHVNALGAELKGVEKDGLEFLWQGDKDSYPRTSPTLFPIMGRFLSDTYYVGDKAYNMGLNGIAMDLNFTNGFLLQRLQFVVLAVWDPISLSFW